jgi:hypothetical protein
MFLFSLVAIGLLLSDETCLINLDDNFNYEYPNLLLIVMDWWRLTYQIAQIIILLRISKKLITLLSNKYDLNLRSKRACIVTLGCLLMVGRLNKLQIKTAVRFVIGLMD